MRKTWKSLMALAAMALLALPTEAQNLDSARAHASHRGVRAAMLLPATSACSLVAPAVYGQNQPTMLLSAVEKARIDRECFVQSRPIAGAESRLVADGVPTHRAAIKPRTSLPDSQSLRLDNVRKAAGEVKDEHGIITQPAEGVVKYYKRSGMALFPKEGEVYETEQTGHVEVVECADGTVYVKDFISRYNYPGAWIKGAKNGNEWTFAAGQRIFYSLAYKCTVSVNFGSYDYDEEDWTKDATRKTITLTVSGDQLILDDSSVDNYLGTFWDDDNAFTGYGDYATVWTLHPGYTPAGYESAQLPEGLTPTMWYSQSQAGKGFVQVAMSGNDIYLGGLFADFPDTWLKGTISGQTITLPAYQYLGQQGIKHYWMMGSDDGTHECDVVLNYDAEAGKITANTKFLVQTSEADKLEPVKYLIGLLIQKDPFDEAAAQTGDPIDELPYSNTFDTEAEQQAFGTIDDNEDGITWTFENGVAYNRFSQTEKADDWLVSPGIRLEQGKKYRFAIDIRSGAAAYTERFEVRMGTEPKPSLMSTQIVPVTETNDMTFRTYENKEIEVAQTGYYHFGIHHLSDASQWRLFADNFLVEAVAVPSAPAAATDFTATSLTDELAVSVGFKAPTMNVEGNKLTANLDKVEVLRDGQAVKTFTNVAPGTQLTYTDKGQNLTLGYHDYQAVAYNEAGIGDKTEALKVLVNGAVGVPYLADFTQEGSMDVFTIINVNDDEATWAWNDVWSAYYEFDNDHAADDYLVTSAIRLQGGVNYRVALNARCTRTVCPERLEVKVGNQPTAEALTLTAIEPTDVVNTTFDEFEGEFTAPADGIYYVGIHAISDEAMWRLMVSQLVVERGFEPTTPDSVTNLKVVRGAEGALMATVSFNAPAQSIDGIALSGKLSHVDLLRDGVVVAQANDVAPGQTLTLTDIDETMTNGTHEYQMIPYDAAGKGGRKSQRVSVFIGVDIPLTVEDLRTIDKTESLVFEWTKVGNVGLNGEYVRTADVNYQVWTAEKQTYEEYVYWDLDQKLGEVKDASMAEVAYDTEAGERQEQKVFAVVTSNVAGDGYEALTARAVGPSYDGFEEHFAEHSTSYNTWAITTTDSENKDNGAFFYSNSSDGDGYSMLLNMESDNQIMTLTAGKVGILAGATNPQFVFDYLNPNTNIKLRMLIELPDGTFDEVDQPFPNGNDWQQARISLLKYADYRYFIFHLVAEFQKAGSLAFDNFIMLDQLEYNLAADIEAPKTVMPGQEADVKVAIRNLGEREAKGYSVKLFANDKELQLDQQPAAIQPMTTANFTATYAPTVFDEPGSVTLRAEVEYDLDLDEDDNVAETLVELLTPAVEAPASLTAEGRGPVAKLDWTLPASGELAPMTEDFEDTYLYEPFSLGGITATKHNGQLGDWMLYDGNGLNVYSFQNIDYDGASAPSAWQVANFDVALGLASVLTTYSGKQVLWSFCPAEETEEGELLTPRADHWLISPELSGLTQTVRFQQRVISVDYGYETFEVLASSTDREISSFKPVAEFAKDNIEWEEVTAELPAGTKYFAIRHTSENVFGLLIDDVTYTPAGGDLSNFNIYVDEELVATVDGGVFTYTTKALSKGEHKVSVTAVYGDLESLPVSATVNLDDATAIENVINARRLTDIFSTDGKLVRQNAQGTEGLKPGIYVIGNQKVTVK